MTQNPCKYLRSIACLLVIFLTIPNGFSQVGPERFNERNTLLVDLIGRYDSFVGFKLMDKSNTISPMFTGKNILSSIEYGWDEGKLRDIHHNFYKDDLLRVANWYSGSDTVDMRNNRVVSIDSFFYDDAKRLIDIKSYQRGLDVPLELGHWCTFTNTARGYSHYFHLYRENTDPKTFLFDDKGMLVEQQSYRKYSKDTFKIIYTYDKLNRLTDIRSSCPAEQRADTAVRIRIVHKSDQMAEVYMDNASKPELIIYTGKDYYLLTHTISKGVRKYYLNGNEYTGKYDPQVKFDPENFNQWETKREYKYDDFGNPIEYKYGDGEYLARTRIKYK